MSTERPLSIGFSDLRGFSSYTAERGDREAYRIAQKFTELVERQVDEHDGEVLKTYGDGVMTSFEDAEQAVHCAAGMQRALCAFNDRHEDEPISAGIGLTWGSVIHTGDDLFGHTVNFAKRLADVAKGGQIIVSSSLCERTGKEESGFCFRDLGERSIKGLGAHRLYELVWREEVANLCLTDDTLNVVLTEDDKLVLEFAKPLEEKLRAVQEKLEATESESQLVSTLKRKLSSSLKHYIPKWIDAADRMAGMGIEHQLEEIDAGIEKGRLTITLPGGKRMAFRKEQVDRAEALRFLEKLQSRKGSGKHRPSR